MLIRRLYRSYSGVALVAVTFLGVLLWARANDPFQGLNFSVESRNGKRMKCVAVLPKPVSTYPVVILVPGSGDRLFASGKALRQLAELGLAAVIIEYADRNPVDFDDQFAALSRYVSTQPWAKANAAGWLAEGLGVEDALDFALAHPDYQPQLLIQWVEGRTPALPDVNQHIRSDHGLRRSESKKPRQDTSDVTLAPLLHCQVLLVNGGLDESVAVEQCEQFVKILVGQETRVDFRIVDDQSQGFGDNADLVRRLVAEDCARFFGQTTNCTANDRISSWYYRVPALLAMLAFFFRSCRSVFVERASGELRASKFGLCLFRLARFLALIALIQTALNLVLPEMHARGAVISLARAMVVPRAWRAEYDFLTTDPDWARQPLGTLLEHAEYCNLQRHWFYTTLNQTFYRHYLLSPRMIAAERKDWDWRRDLWEVFSPRGRKTQDPLQAAQIVVRFLRERVEMRTACSSLGIRRCWKRQLTDEKGFESLYVAALRSVGIASRLNQLGHAQIWNDRIWQGAPRPLASFVHVREGAEHERIAHASPTCRMLRHL